MQFLTSALLIVLHSFFLLWNFFFLCLFMQWLHLALWHFAQPLKDLNLWTCQQCVFPDDMRTRSRTFFTRTPNASDGKRRRSPRAMNEISILQRRVHRHTHTLPLTQRSTGSVHAGHSFSLPSCFGWYRKMGDPVGRPPSILCPCLAVNELSWWGKSKPKFLISKCHYLETRCLCPRGSVVLEFQWGKFRQ